MKVIPFRPEHVMAVKLQPMQAEALPELSLEYGRELAERGPAFTGMVADTVVACGGMATLGADIWYLWALISLQANMLAVTRAAKTMLGLYQNGLQYMAIRSDFPQARRWATMLGFRLEQSQFAEASGVPMDLYKRAQWNG